MCMMCLVVMVWCVFGMSCGCVWGCCDYGLDMFVGMC